MASISKIGNRWRALVRRKGIVRCKTFGSRREATDWASTVEAAILKKDATGYYEPKTATIKDLVDKYEEEVRCTETTLSILRVMKREIGHLKLRDIGKTHVSDWAKKRLRHCSAATVCIYLSTAARVFKWGREQKELDIPVELWSNARAQLRANNHVTRSKPRERIATEHELQRILDYYATQSKARMPMEDIVRVAVSTGLRRGEICRITKGDFDPV